MEQRTLTLSDDDMTFIALVLDLHADRMEAASERARRKGQEQTAAELTSAMQRSIRLMKATLSATRVR